MPEQTTKKQPSIFIVDDEPAVAEVIHALLELDGLDACFFTNPLEALESFKSSEVKPKLMITDYQMPKMNGMELIQEVKAIAPELRVISASGTLNRDEMKKYAIQPNCFLAKPFYPRDLIALVHEQLETVQT